MYAIALLAAEQHDRRNMLRIYRRQLRDATDPFTIPDHRFIELYRLSKDAALDLLNEMSPYMSMGTRKTFIPPPLRMCSALHFFAKGSFYRDIGQDGTAFISKSVVCRSVHEIADILEKKLMAKWIKFPTSSQYDSIKQKFYEGTGFPGVIGAIDCIHVRIKKPKQDVESCYLNRKGYHSKNVQLICDYNLKILGGLARFGGSTHDSYIWEASRINLLLQQRYEVDKSNHSWLLGDTEYPLLPWLITPYRSSNEEEKRFNKVHAHARKCVERLDGVLKGVFRCLQVGLNTSPQMAGKIINACAVLHNFRKEHGLLTEDNIMKNIIESNIVHRDEEEFPETLQEAYRLRDRLKDQICKRNQRL